MKVLLIAADGEETDYPALKAFLDQLGIPYDTLIGTQRQLTWDMLSDGASHGYYQGIILTTGNLGYDAGGGNWQSAFDGNEWFALWDYEAKFGVRQMTSYTVPGGWPDTYGLNYVGVPGYHGDAATDHADDGRQDDVSLSEYCQSDHDQECLDLPGHSDLARRNDASAGDVEWLCDLLNH